jgi:hypothetical protein
MLLVKKSNHLLRVAPTRNFRGALEITASLSVFMAF